MTVQVPTDRPSPFRYRPPVARNRLTRAESRARTIEALIESAERVCLRKGFAQASVEEIAEGAGYSKGAVYANFESKEALFLAVQERRNREWIAGLDDAVAGATSAVDLVQRVGRWHDAHIHTDVDRFILDGDFWLVAARNPKLRETVAEVFARGFERAAGLIAAQAAAWDLQLRLPAPTIARILTAVIYGIQTEARFDPGLNKPDVFPLALAVLLGLDPAVVDQDPPGDAART